MLIDGPYQCPSGIIILPPLVHGLFDVRYVMGPFRVYALANVNDDTMQDVVSGYVIPC